MERREARRDGQGAAIVVPVRRRVVLVLIRVLQFVVVGFAVEEGAGAAALVAVERAGKAEELVEGLAAEAAAKEAPTSAATARWSA
nr:unnamed protein product [Digitaria exilis]CAB3459060.1 unnamed protein product [Digitaria exilis]